jgi:hypothetical protein
MEANNQTTEDISHEVVENQTTAPAQIPVIEQEITQQLQKFNIADAAIAQMKEKFSGLKIRDLDDREGMKAVKSAWQIVRNNRLAIEKKHKEIKADYLAVSRAIDGEKNRLLDLITPLEDELKTELDRMETERREAEEARERLEQERLQGRVNLLIEHGMAFNGSFYAIGETVALDVVTLKNLQENEFSALLERVKLENAKIIEARQAEEARQREEREKFQREQEEQQRRADELKKQEEDMKRQQADMIKTRTDLRVEVLKNAGFAVQGEWLQFRNSMGFVSIAVTELQQLNGDAWDGKYAELRNDIKGLQIREAEEAQRIERENAEKERRRRELEAIERRANLRASEVIKSFGLTYEGGDYIREFHTEGAPSVIRVKAHDLTDATDEQWNEAIKTIHALFNEYSQGESDYKAYLVRKKELEDKARAEEAERQRVARLGDIEKAREYINFLYGVPVPEVKDNGLRALLRSVYDAINLVVTELE